MASPNSGLPITRLPPEIMGEISDACDSYRTFCNLAFACKALARLAAPVLDRHRSAYQRFRFASDLDPTCLPTLVRSVVLRKDPVVVEYARSIDIWGTRLSWDEWRQYEVNERGVHMRGDPVEFERFNENEIKKLLALTRDLVGEEELDAAREELENGADGLLKFLVIVSCPRLQSLRFIQRKDVLHKSCQVWLEKSIQRTLDHGTRWPPGLVSLREAAVGVDAGILDEHIQVIDPDLRSDKDSRHSLARFLQLPRVKTLYYRVERTLGGRDDDVDEGRRIELPHESSHVQNLFIDNVMGASLDYLADLTNAILELKTFAFRLGNSENALDQPHEFLEILASVHSDTLKKVMFYNPKGLNGYDCEHFLPENMEGFQRLTMWYQSANDLERQAFYDADCAVGSNELCDTFRQYLHPNECGPEVLVLDGCVGDLAYDRGSAWSYFDDAIVATIIENNGCHGRARLKAMFVPAPNTGDRDMKEQQQKTTSSSETPLVYPKATKAAEDLDVDLYVFGNGRGTAVKKHPLYFPQAVTKWDIPSGPDYGKRVKDGFVAFNPLSGEWKHYSEPGNGYYIEM